MKHLFKMTNVPKARKIYFNGKQFVTTLASDDKCETVKGESLAKRGYNESCECNYERRVNEGSDSDSNTNSSSSS